MWDSNFPLINRECLQELSLTLIKFQHFFKFDLFANDLASAASTKYLVTKLGKRGKNPKLEITNQ